MSSSRSNIREISNDVLKRQLVSGGGSTSTLKRRHLPLAYNLYRQDQLAIKNISIKRSNPEVYQRACQSIKIKWDKSQELQSKYNKLRTIIDQEIKSLREWELEMVRFGEKHPESMVINDASWHWQQDQYKFVHPRVRDRNSQFQFVKTLKRFGSNKSIQKQKFNELYSEWKLCNNNLNVLPWPKIGDRIVDLFELYRCIVLQGGLGRTLKKTIIWKELGSSMRLCGTGDTLFYQLRVIYYKYLLSFEHKYQISKNSNDMNKLKLKHNWIKPNESYNDDMYKYDYEYISGGADEYYPHNNMNKKRKRRKHENDVVNIPFDSLHKKRKIVNKLEYKSHYEYNNGKKAKNITMIDTHNMYGKYKCDKNGINGMNRHFNNYWNGMHMIKGIILSLKSRIGCNVNWGLNRLLFLSYNTKGNIAEPFIIKYYSKELIDALLDLMPNISLDEFDNVNKNEMGNNYNHSLLNMELMSDNFGESKVNKNKLKGIRNDINSLLDPWITRVILRILSNLALTSDNIQCMCEHNILLPYLLQLIKRRDIISSDCYYNNKNFNYSEIHIDAIRIIAYLSQKITLTKWIKKHIESKQEKRYKYNIPKSNIEFNDNKYNIYSKQFVNNLCNILAMNVSLTSVMDNNEYKYWMVYYSLIICCHLAANPNNHGILSKYIKYKINVKNENENSNNSEQKEDINDIKCVDLSNVISFNGVIDTSNLMVFNEENKNENETEKENEEMYGEYEWILPIIIQISSPHAGIKLYAIEALVYLFESNINYTKYVFYHKDVIKQLIIDLVGIGNNDFYGQQLYRSASYLLSLLYKQCGKENNNKQLFSNVNNRIFESCAQYDDFACYAIHLADLKRENPI